MFLSIFPVWSELNLMSQVYWIITAPATVIFLLLVLLTFFGSDVDADVQTDFDHSISDGDSIPFQFLSMKSIIGFFTMFGWSGLGFLSAGLASWMVIIFSVICGLVMMVVMASLFYFMSKLAESGTLNMRNAIGHLGEVYLTIPAKRDGMGKVQLTVQGSLRTLEAITDDPEAIVTSSLIEVIDVIDQQILLVKRNTR